MKELNDGDPEENFNLSVYKIDKKNYILGINDNKILKFKKSKSVEKFNSSVTPDKLTIANNRYNIIHDFIDYVAEGKKNYKKIKKASNAEDYNKIYKGINIFLLNQLIFLCKTIFNFKDNKHI